MEILIIFQYSVINFKNDENIHIDLIKQFRFDDL